MQELPNQKSRMVTKDSPPADKIQLFRSLFRGREDIYPRRFESRKTGRAGYSPACGNEWVRGVCEKPKIKCSECPNQCFLRVTDEVIRQHLLGCDENGRDFVMGSYPMLLDETCYFLAVDFDGNGLHGKLNGEDELQAFDSRYPKTAMIFPGLRRRPVGTKTHRLLVTCQERSNLCLAIKFTLQRTNCRLACATA